MKKSLLALSILLFCIPFQYTLAKPDKDFVKYARYIDRNRADKITELYSSGKNINAMDDKGRTPLLYALQKNKSHLAEVILNFSADISQTDKDRNGCLHYAIENCDNSNIVFLLMEVGADIHLRNSALYTPLHIAVLYNRVDIAMDLIEKGVDYKMYTTFDENIIHLAAESGSDTLIRFFIAQGIPHDHADLNGNTPFLNALKNERRSSAHLLYSYGVNPGIENKQQYTPIYYTIQNNDSILFERLIEKNVNVDISANGISPLLLAAIVENDYFLQQLLKHGAVNPLNCDTPDVCMLSAHIAAVNAEMASKNERQHKYQTSLNLYHLSLEKYQDELGRVRAKNTAKVTGEVVWIAASVAMYAMGGTYSTGFFLFEYEKQYRDFLKSRIKRCKEEIKEVEALHHLALTF